MKEIHWYILCWIVLIMVAIAFFVNVMCAPTKL
jgi:hypothetical protein